MTGTKKSRRRARRAAAPERVPVAPAPRPLPCSNLPKTTMGTHQAAGPRRHTERAQGGFGVSSPRHAQPASSAWRAAAWCSAS